MSLDRRRSESSSTVDVSAHPVPDTPAESVLCRPGPRVLFVAGMHRSGTTLIARLLGGLAGFFCAGELHSIWSSRLCGCGQELDACPVWSAVLAVAGRDRPLDAQQMLALQSSIRSRPRQLAAMRRAAFSSESTLPAQRYADTMRRVFCAIQDVTGATTVVDSTKTPHYAYLTAKLARLEVYVLHIVRDPRAVAYSWSRAVPDPSKVTGRMGTVGPLASSARWTVWNGLIETMTRKAVCDRYLRVRYEDFAKEPAALVESVRGFMDLPKTRGPKFIDRHTVELSRDHTVSGNPGRFRSGPTRIELDDRWRTEMARRMRLLAMLPALPLMPHHGYRPSLS